MWNRVAVRGRAILRCAQNDNDLRRLMHNPRKRGDPLPALRACDSRRNTNLEKALRSVFVPPIRIQRQQGPERPYRRCQCRDGKENPQCDMPVQPKLVECAADQDAKGNH